MNLKVLAIHGARHAVTGVPVEALIICCGSCGGNAFHVYRSCQHKHWHLQCHSCHENALDKQVTIEETSEEDSENGHSHS